MDKFWGIARHVIGGIGAGIVGFGFASADDVSGVLGNMDTIIGSFMAIAAVGASIWSKIKAARS